MANIFSAKCGSLDYFVYGSYRRGQLLRLTGTWPKRDKKTCLIIDNISTGPNSKLVFSPLETELETETQVDGYCGRYAKVAINVRVGPGLDFARIDQIPAGTCGVKVLQNLCRGKWCPLEDGTRINGWIHTRNLSE